MDKKFHNTLLLQVMIEEEINTWIQLKKSFKRDITGLREKGGSVDMELTVRIDGKPFSLEEGESKHNIEAISFIEAFIPIKAAKILV